MRKSCPSNGDYYQKGTPMTRPMLNTRAQQIAAVCPLTWDQVANLAWMACEESPDQATWVMWSGEVGEVAGWLWDYWQKGMELDGWEFPEIEAFFGPDRHVLRKGDMKALRPIARSVAQRREMASERGVG